jgi:hypothetical protein
MWNWTWVPTRSARGLAGTIMDRGFLIRGEGCSEGQLVSFLPPNIGSSLSFSILSLFLSRQLQR